MVKIKLLKQTVSFSVIGIIKLYQWGVSPLIGPRCRFYPSCSHYAIEAVESFGIFKGSFVALKRLLRCHPFHPGGVDMIKKHRE